VNMSILPLLVGRSYELRCLGVKTFLGCHAATLWWASFCAKGHAAEFDGRSQVEARKV
jgi:hypothetical protein